ncbi:MAG TPA: SDR family oxidoreductase [Casimicrobiaceae bacterium]|nr:SDR family oxidoreductase [Casimicrobiaceae bacterium]
MTNDPFRLDGKVAIVTGSSRGIGRAIVEALARAGASVVVSSRKIDACEAVAKEIRNDGLRAIALACHAGRNDELDRLVATTIQEFGRLDVCVANVAVNPVFGPLGSLTDEAWSKVMDVNVRSVFALANLSVPHLEAHRDGAFIAISSIGALRTEHGIGAYNVSKLALIGLVQNLASEWGPRGVRVNAIAPGVIRTDFAKALWENPSIKEKLESVTPLRRIGEPDDIGAIAVFLAAPASRFITGQTLVVDGGATLVSATNAG